MRPPLHVLASSACVIAFGVGLPQAAAQEADDDPRVVEAREVVARGEALFAEGNHEGALVEYRRAYTLLEGHPAQYRLRFNMARAHEQMFQYDEAIAAYQAYLEEGGPDAPLRDVVRDNLARFEQLLGTLVVRLEGAPEGELWVRERRIGTAPGRFRVPAGRYAIEVRAPGFLPARAEVVLSAGEAVPVLVALEAVDTYRGLDRSIFWTAAGVSAVSLVGAGALGLTVLLQRNAVQSDCDAPLATPPSVENRDCHLEDEARRRERLALAADVWLGVGVAAGVTAVVLYFVTDWGPPASAGADAVGSLRLHPTVGPTHAGLTLEGRF